MYRSAAHDLVSIYCYSVNKGVYKVIVFNKHDLKWAEEHARHVKSSCELFLQPEWSRREEVMPMITDYVMDNPKWRISLQTHKYIGIP